ncbi:MAG: DivIVA domain-containing protein [Actinobacteria bacterium]|nr:DivIVA domain-containing protein [Actinomycetota bacterium]
MTRREPQRPGWLVPTPGEIRAVRFPLALQGYDPDHVDVTFSALADAYEELYVAAGPAAIARAQERLEQRRLEVTEPPATVRSTSAGDGASTAEIS